MQSTLPITTQTPGATPSACSTRAPASACPEPSPSYLLRSTSTTSGNEPGPTVEIPTAAAAPASAHTHQEKRGWVSASVGTWMHVFPPPRGSVDGVHHGSLIRNIPIPTTTPTGTDASCVTIALLGLMSRNPTALLIAKRNGYWRQKTRIVARLERPRSPASENLRLVRCLRGCHRGPPTV